MNVITSTFAVSLFPRTTFVDRVAYSCGHNVTTMRNDWLPTSDSDRVVYSGGRRSELPHTIRSQQRGVADQSSWVIPFYGPDAPPDRESFESDYITGVKFDILDWTDLFVGGTACISVMEPFMFE